MKTLSTYKELINFVINLEKNHIHIGNFLFKGHPIEITGMPLERNAELTIIDNTAIFVTQMQNFFVIQIMSGGCTDEIITLLEFPIELYKEFTTILRYPDFPEEYLESDFKEEILNHLK